MQNTSTTDKRLAPEKPETKRKRRKSNDANEQNDISLTIAPTKKTGRKPRRKHKSSLLDLNGNSLEEIFEWLSVIDLNSIGKTCTRLQKLAGQHFQRTYPYRRVYFHEGVPTIDKWSNHWVDAFYEFFQSIIFDVADGYIKVARNKWIKKFNFNVREIEINWNIVEELYFGHFEFFDGSHEYLLKHCTNLKKLGMIFRGIPKNTEWSHQKYPTIEYLKVMPPRITDDRILNFYKQIVLFLQTNPNIRALSIGVFESIEFFYEALESNVQLDELTIHDFLQNVPISLLNQLYDRGFYKRLQFLSRIPGWDREIFNLKGLELIEDSMSIPQLDVHRSAMAGIKTLLINCHPEVKYIVKNFVNVERVWCSFVYQHQILWYIKVLPKLKEIYADQLHDDDDKLLDLATWNKERQKIRGARKVTIYVDEETFLETKWNTESIDLSLITIKRTQSYLAKAYGPIDL